MKYAIIGAVTGIVTAYLGASFTMWDFNAGNWGDGVRCTVTRSASFASLIFAAIGAIYAQYRIV